MSFELTTRPLWRLPSFWDEDDDTNWPGFSAASGVSISEDDGHVYVTAAVPGVHENDIEVTFDKGVLWIKGETKEAEEDKKRKYYRRSANSFSYRVNVPGDLDLHTDPEADYKNGIMTVTFKKSPQSQPKKITVKAKK